MPNNSVPEEGWQYEAAGKSKFRMDEKLTLRLSPFGTKADMPGRIGNVS